MTAPARFRLTGRPPRRSATLRHLLDHRFRANPEFELVALDRLQEGHRPTFDQPASGGAKDTRQAQDTGQAQDMVLVPRSGPGISPKVLNGAAARLVESLRVPGSLPTETREHGDAAANRAVARLVLDGALEIEAGGVFVSGPRAHGALFRRGSRAPAGGPLAALSLRAIRYGQELLIDDVEVLARRLYTFGAVPRGPRWDRLAGAGDDVMGLLGLGPGGDARRVLSDDYEPVHHPGWLAWSRRLEGAQRRPELPYKLYISPRPESMAACFSAVVGVLAAERVWSFKVGRGVVGLLRPDKVVAYLEDFDHLERAVGALTSALDGCPAQGVPFTAEASADGLLSWGMDPPTEEGLFGTQRQESWRSWVTNRLASGLVHAQSGGCVVEPWVFALDRLALEGVDASWLPADSIWPRSGHI